MNIKTKNNLLLIIDMQYDFCNPKGALYVPGSEDDVKRVCHFISQNHESIDHIALSQDQHQVMDISHPKFWVNKEGIHPEPFTQISFADVLQGLWKPILEEEKAQGYIEKLEQQGEYPHVIWPEHCIMGTKGSEIVIELMESIENWAANNKQFTLIKKGANPLTEHFGALRANIPIDVDTNTNKELVETFKKYDHIYIAGEAQSHCVANTIKQMLEIEGLAQKMIILEDCMSNVPGFEHIAHDIYLNAKDAGVKFSKVN